MGKLSNSKDILLLLLYVPGSNGQIGDPIQGHTRIMKMIFLFKKELSRQFSLGNSIQDTAFPDFEPFDYGPYSSTVFADLEFLVNTGFIDLPEKRDRETIDEERTEFDYWRISEKKEDADTDYSLVGRTFKISERGRKFVEARLLPASGISQSQLDALSEFKKRCCNATLRSLLRYVYSRYDDMTTKSKIRDAVLE